MGIFYTRNLIQPPKRPEDGSPGLSIAPVQNGGPPMQFSWVRFGIAAGMLLVVLGACIYTGLVEPRGTPPVNPLQDLHKALLHAFEVLLGAIVGLLTGEAVASRS